MMAPPIGTPTNVPKATMKYMVLYLLPNSSVLQICPQQTGNNEKIEPEKKPYTAA